MLYPFPGKDAEENENFFQNKTEGDTHVNKISIEFDLFDVPFKNDNITD